MCMCKHLRMLLKHTEISCVRSRERMSARMKAWPSHAHNKWMHGETHTQAYISKSRREGRMGRRQRTVVPSGKERSRLCTYRPPLRLSMCIWEVSVCVCVCVCVLWAELHTYPKCQAGLQHGSQAHSADTSAHSECRPALHIPYP